MNKRIFELGRQATIWCCGNLNSDTSREDWDAAWEQKFAELIVRECLEQVRDEVQYEYDWKLADAVSKRVLEHFGVGE